MKEDVMFHRIMRVHAFVLSLAALRTGALFVAPAVAAAEYAYQTVDVPFGVPGQDLDVQIVWMNNAGVITVQYQSPRSPNFLENMHTAMLSRGAWTIIDVPDATTTGGTNASNRGQVVLSHMFDDGIWHAAYYSRRGLRAFPDIPGYPGGIIVQGVNDCGQVAAVVIDAGGAWHGFVGDGERYSIFDYPDASYTQVNMANNSGVAVGYYGLSDGSFHAFKWENGQISNIDPASGTVAVATAINNAGVIVGGHDNAEGVSVGYMQDDGEFQEIAVPDSMFTLPYFINDRGQI